jgi:hypothetical protein
LKTWDKIIPCSNPGCQQKFFVLSDIRNVRCPFCGTKPAGPIPVLNLYKETRPGEWLPDGELVVHAGTALCLWHVYDNVLPGPDVDKTVQAYFAFRNGKWLIVNQKLTSLVSPGGNPVPPDKAAALTDGAQIRLSREPHGRIAEVKLIKV